MLPSTLRIKLTKYTEYELKMIEGWRRWHKSFSSLIQFSEAQ